MTRNKSKLLRKSISQFSPFGVPSRGVSLFFFTVDHKTLPLSTRGGFIAPLPCMPTFAHSGCTSANNKRQRVIRAMHGRNQRYCATINGDNGANFLSVYFCCLWRRSNLWGNEWVACVFCQRGGSVTALCETRMLEEEKEREQLNHSPSSLG